MENKSYSPKQIFVLNLAERAYKAEQERSKNILNQAQRLLPMQTFLVSALTFIYPLVIKLLENNENIQFSNENIDFSTMTFFLTIVFSLISLALNVASQWGYKTYTFPFPSYIEESIDKHLIEQQIAYTPDIEYTVLKDLLDKIIKSLRKCNNKKALSLYFSMLSLLISIIFFILFVIPLAK